MKKQCTHCRGDYTVKKNGDLHKHDCWAYLNGVVVFGPQDRHERYRGPLTSERLTNQK